MQEIQEIIEALSDEIKAVKKKYLQHPITITHLKITNVFGEYYYEGIVGSLEEGDLLAIPEGVPVKVLYEEYNRIQKCWDLLTRNGKLLYYDSVKHHIVIFIAGPPIDFQDCKNRYKIQPTIEELLLALQQELNVIHFYRQSLGAQILRNSFLPCEIIYPPRKILDKFLNQSQVDAVKKIFGNTISFLWGPPGTGKTTTIAAMIHEFKLLGKKVLAVSVSNIAVDQIAIKCVDADGYPMLKKGEMVRFGYARLKNVRDQDILFPERDHISLLRKQIRELESKIAEAREPVLKAKYQKDIAEKQKEIKKAIIEPLFYAKAVFTTATQVCLSEEFREINFDVVIVDEASMMSIPMIIYLSSVAKEKFIISGDYRQLQPIAIAKTLFASKWLHRDVFELAGISNGGTHPLLSLLNVQHRMTEDICDIINQAFYFNKLVTNIKDENRYGANYPPQPGKPVIFVSVTVEEGNNTQRTDNHSRYNLETSDMVIKLIEKIVRRPGKAEIGVITPYAAQAQRIKKMISEKSKNDVNPKFKEIKVGTVHSFQGDESDIIIFDLVDNSVVGPGKLFKGKEGERLFNVAISRAKGKLIVVGDPELFTSREDDFKGIALIYETIKLKYK